jgi:hypothetical protein
MSETIRPNRDSEVKARDALALLSVAQIADSQTAARLMEHLTIDGPLTNERPEIAKLHFRAVEVFKELADSLSDPSSRKPPPWKTAVDVTTHWLDVLDIGW